MTGPTVAIATTAAEEWYDLFAEIGLQALSFVTSMERMGHSTVEGHLYYVQGEPSFMLDLLRWASGGPDAEVGRARCREWIAGTPMDSVLAELGEEKLRRMLGELPEEVTPLEAS